ncbi:hypothetical protein QFC21_000401 [Naganishia friedmannii]|uniref:Uncharacterized protein n=1 Tax=Naganishia friedmannii TaxID=89922 RepID=A0ACC2WBD6_9TREE|nr:hypothetical protein QFC21_000401 [Naganishia friedmannii]
MYRQVRLVNSSRLSANARLSIRRYAVDSSSPSTRGPTAPGIPPIPPTAVNAKPVATVVVPTNAARVTKPDVILPLDATVKPVPVVVKPVPVVVKTGGAPPPPPSPPPPQAPKPPSKFFRKLFLYLTLGTLVFYPTSAYLSLQSDKYRDFFTSTFPLADKLIEYADDNDWDQYGLSTLTGGAGAGPERRPATAVVNSTKDIIAAAQDKAKEVRTTVAQKAETLAAQASKKLNEVKHTAASTVSDLKMETKREAASFEKAAESTTDKAKNEARRTVDQLKAVAADAAQTIKEKAAQAASEVKSIHFSDGVTELVDKAEHALGRAEAKAESVLHRAEDKAQAALNTAESKLQNAESKAEHAVQDIKAVSQAPVPANVQAQMVDTQPKRDVVADDTGKPKKKAYSGPALPIGFEPPPGYYVPKATEPTIDSSKKELAADPLQAGLPEHKPVLPLLAPKVHEFTSANDEPIISQLASTIDSLAESLSATSSAAGSTSSTDAASPVAILSRAQNDLSSLSTRLQALKDEEKIKLEQTAESKRQEFEAQLKQKEVEWTNKEGELLEGWKEEREKLVDGWRKVLDRELEGQRVGIEQRLREEVIAQGIELQRRWLRSIKAQVETERGGRLAKLDNLTTSFKQLEKITLDNSSQLDANVSLHTLWSALRAVQAKADRGGVAFDDELRVLKTAAAAQAGATADPAARSVIESMIESIESSGAAQQGIKSFPSLAAWFSTTLAPKIQSVSLVPAEHQAGVLSHIASAGLSKLLFRRKAGWVEGDDVSAVLARAEYLLSEKDLDGAARQVNQLKGWAGKLAGDWLREARKRLEVEQALGVIATEATLSSLLLV